MKHRQEGLSRSGKRGIMVLLPVFVAVMVIVHIIQSAPSARLAELSKEEKTSDNPMRISAMVVESTDDHGLSPVLTSQLECPQNTMFGQTPGFPNLSF